MTKEVKHSMTGSMLRVLLITAVLLCCKTWILPDFVLAQDKKAQQPNMVHVIQSKKSFPETLKVFQEKVSKAGWSVLTVNNMAGVLSERGFTLHPVVILDVCSGSYSARILSNDNYRPMSAFMPCRVSIYQTSDGKVYIARMNTNAFLKMMPPEVAEVMLASDEEIAKVIAETAR